MNHLPSSKARLHACCAILIDPLTGRARPRHRVRKGKLVPCRGFVMHYRDGEFRTHDGQLYIVTNGQVRRHKERGVR